MKGKFFASDFSSHPLSKPASSARHCFVGASGPTHRTEENHMKTRGTSGYVIGFWIVTGLFCLQMGFTAYAQLRLPQVAAAFTHMGFPDYFRVELALAKLL